MLRRRVSQMATSTKRRRRVSQETTSAKNRTQHPPPRVAPPLVGVDIMKIVSAPKALVAVLVGFAVSAYYYASQHMATATHKQGLLFGSHPNTSRDWRDTWCPNATCMNSPLCQPCNQRFLFILTTPRAASTTLLSMINYLPNVSLYSY